MKKISQFTVQRKKIIIINFYLPTRPPQKKLYVPHLSLGIKEKKEILRWDILYEEFSDKRDEEKFYDSSLIKRFAVERQTFF